MHLSFLYNLKHGKCSVRAVSRANDFKIICKSPIMGMLYINNPSGVYTPDRERDTYSKLQFCIVLKYLGGLKQWVV